MRCWTGLLAAALLPCCITPLSAQTAGLRVGVLNSPWPNGNGGLERVGFAPSVSVGRTAWSLEAGGIGEWGGGMGTLVSGEAAGALLGPRVAGFRTELTAHALHLGSGDWNSETETVARLHRAGTRFGAWVGAGSLRPEGQGWRPVAQVGAWWNSRTTSLSLVVENAATSSTSRWSTVQIGDTLARIQRTTTTRSAFQRVRAELSLARSRIELRLAEIRWTETAGLTRTEMQAGATGWLTPTIGLTAAYAPSLSIGQLPAPSTLRFGVMLRPHGMTRHPATLVAIATTEEASLEPIGGEGYRLKVPAPGARLVEVEGTATDWVPVALERAAHGRWVGEFQLPPGRQEFLMRVDGGAWRPLPGLFTAEDPLLGAVTVFVAAP